MPSSSKPNAEPTGVVRNATVVMSPEKKQGLMTPKRSSSWAFGMTRQSLTTSQEDLETSPSSPSPRPSWNASLTMTVNVLRKTLELNKDSIKKARAISSVGAAPSPVSVRIEKIRIPRRPDCLPENMDVKDAQGMIKAEWMDYHKDNLKTDDGRVILYLHGGAYIICNRKSHRGITWRVAKHSRCKVLVVDYRLAPEHTHPLALHDALSAYLYLTDPPQVEGNGPQLRRYKPSEIVIMGDSAGGGLSMAMGLWLRDHPEMGWGMPAGLALLSPWLDLTQSMPSFKLNNLDYLPEGSNDPLYINENRKNYYVSNNSFLTSPYVSPLFATEDPEKPMCPMMIHCGSLERLRDEILHFTVAKFPNSNIQLEMYDDMVHVFQMLAAMLRVGDLALQRLGAFVQRVTSPTAPSPSRSMIRVAHSKGYPERSFSEDDAKSIIEEGFELLGRGGEVVIGVGAGDGNRDGGVEGEGEVDVEEVKENEAVDAQLDAFEEAEEKEEVIGEKEMARAESEAETK
ncbi:hypothetical protein HDU67_003040 [Dinochytrium kinnereticum]|nr:hypothetical protein HDU67_003040 [Dinochytrium kinnereticum]